MRISKVGVITCSFNLIRWLCFIWHQTQETATGQSWTLLILRALHPLQYNQESTHLLTILCTSVLPSFFGWSGLCGGDKLNQSEFGSLLSGDTSSPNSGSSSRSLQVARSNKTFVKFWSVILFIPRCQTVCCNSVNCSNLLSSTIMQFYQFIKHMLKFSKKSIQFWFSCVIGEMICLYII